MKEIKNKKANIDEFISSYFQLTFMYKKSRILLLYFEDIFYKRKKSFFLFL